MYLLIDLLRVTHQPIKYASDSLQNPPKIKFKKKGGGLFDFPKSLS